MSGLSPFRRMTEFKHPKTGNRAAVPPDTLLFRNNLYTVHVDAPVYSNAATHFDGQRIVHLSIKRNDRKPIHSWADLQWIKNQLVGPETEAIELYPAESRVIDAANQYHLWVIQGRWPVGFQVEEDESREATPEEAAEWGAVQNRRQR